jgi:hypothetical protein
VSCAWTGPIELLPQQHYQCGDLVDAQPDREVEPGPSALLVSARDGVAASRRPSDQRQAGAAGAPPGRVASEPKTAERQRTQQVNEVWSWNFVEDQTENGTRFRVLTLLDEHTWECLAVHVDWSVRAVEVITARIDREQGGGAVAKWGLRAGTPRLSFNSGRRKVAIVLPAPVDSAHGLQCRSPALSKICQENRLFAGFSCFVSP